MRQNKFYGFMKGFLPVVAAGAVIFGLSRNISRENSNLEKKLEIPKQVQTQAKPQEKKLPINYDAIEQIESAGNPKAYNKNSGARGLRQITLIVLEEWNQFHPNEKYNSEDLFDININRKIGNWYMDERIPDYLKHFSLEDNIENRLAAYNWGIGNLRKIRDANSNFDKLPEETQNYIQNYRKLVKEK